MSLNVKACIITGAGRGIGRATAQRLTAAGMNVLAVARTAADLDETVQSTRDHSGQCLVEVADVTDRAQVDRAVARARKKFGRIDALINNAGLAPLSPVATMTDDAFARTNAVNINAVFYTCRAAWPDLTATRGCIINLSSMASTDPFPGFAAYGAAKAWVNLFTRALADEGKPSGIRAFAVAPGAVETTMLRGAFPDFPAAETLAPEEVAGLIETLLDERCRYASGQTVIIRK